MANPLFNGLFGGSANGMNTGKSAMPEAGRTAGNAPQMTIQDALREVNEHPAELLRQAGVNVPKECIGNNQATVMYLLRSGQVGGPMMRMLAPLLGRMGIR